MLIESLVAENFRKYQKLEINDIPQNGAITISGSNESGKTSIGEAICFALFGRTFFLDEKNLTKLVFWGKKSAEVTLNFSADKYGKFELYRSVDRDGIVTARLLKISSKTKNKALENQTDITKALTKILGFDYDAFANSFYLVQRELTSPEPQSESIKKMAGIGDYASISDELLSKSHENESKIKSIEPEAKSTEANLNKINIDESWLPELVDGEQTLESEQQQRQSLLSHLSDDEQRYANNAKPYKSARKSRGFFGFLSFLLFPIFLFSLLLWVVQKFRPEIVDETLMGLFGLDVLATIQGLLSQWLLPVAIISGIGFLLSLVLKKKSMAVMRELDAEAKDFAGSLQEGHSLVTTDIESLLPDRVAQLMHKSNNNEDSTLLATPPKEQFTNIETLTENTSGYVADSQELNAAVSRLTDTFDKQLGEIKQLSTGLNVDIDKEKVRSDEAGVLRASLKTLNAEINGCKRQIKTNQTATAILQRAGKDSINLFNKNITKSSAASLPKFTDGRYSEVRIAEDFSVQVYSDRKRDYMDFDEISSGTQRQVMLALRLAMSEELAKNTGNEQQFIFLDEPFAFFDPKRTIATLKALPDISDVISQVWIVAQEFPAVDVDKVIVCPADSTNLSV